MTPPLPTPRYVTTIPRRAAGPRLRLERGGTVVREGEAEERRLGRLATDLLRELIDQGTPRLELIARYLGVSADEVLCIAEGVLPMTPAARRSLARVALAFAPGALRHTARRLLDGDRARR